MKRVLTERGLMIKLSELYDLIQDKMDDNFIDLIKSLILEPGLRIAEGDEFLVHQVGSDLKVKAGGVVFPNYDIFVPSDSMADMSLDLSDIDGVNDSGSIFYIYITLTTDLTHPQRQSGTMDVFYTVQQNVVKVILAAETTAPPSNSYLLAKATVRGDGSISLEDRRMESVLKLVSKYALEGWEADTVPTQVTGVEGRILYLEDFRHAGTEGYAFNNQSLSINRRIGPALEVSWDAPSEEELDAINGVVYYKVVATPDNSLGSSVPQANIEQIVTIDRIGITKSAKPAKRIGCLMPCDLGSYYSVVVYRISDILDMDISAASDAITVMAGISFTEEGTLDVNIEYTLNSTDFIKISTNTTPTPNTVVRVFACEYETTAPSEIEDIRYLVYEGVAQDIIYRVKDKTYTGVSILVQVRGKYSNLIQSVKEEMEFEAMGSEAEFLVYFHVPESADGWPGRDLPVDEATGETATKQDATTVKIAISPGNQPHARQAGDWIYIDNSSDVVMLPDGEYEIDAVADDLITITGVFGAGAACTCDIAGNAKVLPTGAITKLVIPASSHLQGVFSVGNVLLVGNSTDVPDLSDGEYDVVDLDTNEIHIDNPAPGGTSYCDAVALEEIDLLTFTRENDVILSRIKISGFQGQRLHTDDSEHGNIARYIVSSSSGDQHIDVPRSGGGYKEFEEDAQDPIPAGATITLKLTRGGDNLVGINASGYHVFLYFKKAL